MNTALDASKRDALPEVTDETLARIETAVFAEIGADRQRRRARRGRAWAGAGAAAAILVGAALVGPTIISGASGAASDEAVSSVDVVSDGGLTTVPESGDAAQLDAPTTIEGTTIDGMMSDGTTSDGGRTADGAASDASGDRELIASASLSLRVDDIDTSTSAVTEAAEARGGYVESLNVGTDGMVTNGTVTDDAGMPTAVTANGAWVQVRVPADQLTELMDELGELGDVTASNVSRQDVTDQAVDLRARISSAEASVARLTELMSESATLSDLIAAESALAERQATLESYQQQLEMLEGQVEMSTLSVDLTLAQKSVEADPAGFGDGLVAGWNGLIATLNGIVIGLGFLLPWIAVAAVAAAIVWGIRRLVRVRRARRSVAAHAAADRTGD